MTVDQWLDMNGGQNLRRVAELFTVNSNRLHIEGSLGTSVPVEHNRYKRLGLTINEAFELTYYKGIIDALVNSSENPPTAAKAAMERLTREAQGQVIEIATPGKLKELLRR